MRNRVPPPAAMQAMHHVRTDEQHRKAYQHGEAEIAGDLSKHIA